MKKAMTISGTIAVSLFLSGCLFKFMHWPGANAMLLLGILIMSVGFLPMLFVIKSREAEGAREKWINGLGTLSAILVCLSGLFKLLHWPYASILSFSFMASFVVYLVVFGIAAYRKRIKGNQPAVTILLISMAIGLQFAAQNSGKSIEVSKTEIASLMREEQLLIKLRKAQSPQPIDAKSTLALSISNDCQLLKEKILMAELGSKTLSLDEKDLFVMNVSVGSTANESDFQQKLNSLKQNISKYNLLADTDSKVPVKYSILDADPSKISRYAVLHVLQNLVQIQLFLMK